MTEFDKRGFAAVDAFFEGSPDDSAETADHDKTTAQDTTSRHVVGGGSKRLGLGAAAKPNEASRTDIDKRILQVGKKRQRREENGDDESLVSEAEEEDDLGRTAIDESSRPSKISAAVLAKEKANATQTQKKKKKKGKKERSQGREKGASGADEKAEPNLPEDAHSEKAAVDGTSANNEQVSKKKKRRKVRSKQKNIYKDTRAHKPDHLVPGSKDFRGRPLTAETRAKLKLPPSKSSQEKGEASWKSSWDAEPQESSIDVMPLAVEVEDEVPKQAPSGTKSHKKKKNNKSKYKNIQ